MSTIDSLLKYIRQSETLVVVTLSLTIAGLALFAGERWQVFDFHGLPEWARPTALIVWTVSAVHVAIRTVMILWNGARAAARYVAGIPQRRKRTTYERPLIERLLTTKGVEREMLCYALHRGENHLWVNRFDEPRWLLGLKQKGLIEMRDAGWIRTSFMALDSVHYRIHSVAWKYMQRHPSKFINVLGWPDPPGLWYSMKMG
jgi:hypothetical protein